MIKSITFKENYELPLEKESQKRWGTKTYKPTAYTREKKPWTNFFLFKKGLHIDFKPDVNIIVGENGSGKSTLFSLIKNYAGKKPENFVLSMNNLKDEDDYLKYHRETYKGELIIEGDVSFKNAVFFDAEKDNPVIAIPKIGHPGRADFVSLAAQLWFAHEESHGESMLPILEYLLTEAHNGVLFFDEPETALSLKNQIWFANAITKSSKENNNQIIISTHALAIIQQFNEIFDMETRKWVNRQKYINQIMK